MQIHLFSSGDPLLEDIAEVSKPYLQNVGGPVVVYIPPEMKEKYILLTQQAFQGLAEVRVIDLRTIGLEPFRQALREASVIFVPGGNTFYLKYQLQQRRLVACLRQSVLNGVPYVGISAGTILTGENILTSNDINACGCTEFAGLQLVHYNFIAHFPSEGNPEREGKIDRIAAYHEFHRNPVLAIEDGAYLFVDGDKMKQVSGNIWRFEPGKAPVKMQPGTVFCISGDMLAG